MPRRAIHDAQRQFTFRRNNSRAGRCNSWMIRRTAAPGEGSPRGGDEETISRIYRPNAGVFRLNCPVLRKSPVYSRSPEGGSNGGNRRAVSPLAGRRGSWGNLSEGSPMRAFGFFPRERKETPRGERSRGGDEEMRCRQSCNSLHSFRLRRAAANPPPSGRESERCLSLSSLREGALDAAGTKKRAKACCRILITNPMILRFDLV